MANLDTIKYIIEALRQRGPDAGVTRSVRNPVRRISGNPLKDMNKDINYSRYANMQSEVGESPVSYEEWLRK